MMSTYDSLSSWEKRELDNNKRFGEEDNKVVFRSNRAEQTKRFYGHQ